MQINDLFGRAAAFETARLPDGTAAVLPAEHAATLYVNEQPAFRVVCTPELLPQLALGRLLTEGWITSAQEVEQAAVCAEGLKVNVYLNHRLTARSAAAQAVSSCCTDNVTLSSPVELPPLRTVPQLELQPEWLDALAAAMSAGRRCTAPPALCTAALCCGREPSFLPARTSAGTTRWIRLWARCCCRVSRWQNACFIPAAGCPWTWCARPSGRAFRHW